MMASVLALALVAAAPPGGLDRGFGAMAAPQPGSVILNNALTGTDPDGSWWITGTWYATGLPVVSGGQPVRYEAWVQVRSNMEPNGSPWILIGDNLAPDKAGRIEIGFKIDTDFDPFKPDPNGHYQVRPRVSSTQILWGGVAGSWVDAVWQ